MFADDWLTVYQGDCRAVMATLPAESVHCVVTSPPYWGLRDYGDVGQLGLEPTPEEYVANLVDVFREVRRVLRSDGTVWLNLGDSYTSNPGSGQERGNLGGLAGADSPTYQGTMRQAHSAADKRTRTGLKPKDLVGIPWRVAFALQADGWYLRSDIVWAKPNPMPESVTDRPTKSHEYLFLLSKSPRYYFDADAVREPVDTREGRPHDRVRNVGGRTDGYTYGVGGKGFDVPEGGRNIRSVWTIATQPYPGAHFATFPRKLVEPCIKAGTSERGVCPECGAPWERVVEREKVATPRYATSYADAHGPDGRDALRASLNVTTTGWQPSCAHGPSAEWVAMMSKGRTPDELAAAVRLEGHTIPATVLDPFAGSGTTGLVAQSLSRRAILIDLNPEYIIQAMGRNRDIPLGLVG